MCSSRLFSLLFLVLSTSPVAAHPPALPADTIKAARALAPTLRALGGKAAFASLTRHTVRLRATLYREDDTTTASSTYAWEAPDTLRRINELRGVGTIAFVIDGDRVWFQGPNAQKLSPASPDARTYLQSGYWRTLPILLAHAARGTADLRAVRHVRSDTAVVWTVLPPSGNSFRLHIDPDTGRPLRRVFTQQGSTVEDVFSDYRTVGGLRLPYRTISYEDGHRSELIRLTSAAVNPETIPSSIPAVPHGSTP